MPTGNVSKWALYKLCERLATRLPRCHGGRLGNARAWRYAIRVAAQPQPISAFPRRPNGHVSSAVSPGPRHILVRIRQEACLNVCNGLHVVVEEDAMEPIDGGGSDVLLDVVEEHNRFWSRTEAPARFCIDTRIWLYGPDLMRV